MSKILKKTLCGLLALTAFGAVTSFTACETSEPEVEIEIEFNGETYTLEYTLYRKIAPSTVNHFIALAENGYYDGLCVHNYSGTRMYTGGYTYAEGGENGGLEYKDYYATVKADSFKNFKHTVWSDSAKEDPTYTLYGEFEKNNFVVTNGALRETFGSLTMYYTSKDSEDDVYAQRADGNGADWKTYQYNSATSLFYISISETEKSNDNYCTFATLDEDSEEELKALRDAISAYWKSAYGSDAEESDFVTEVEISVDEDDAFVGEKEPTATYKVPNKEIRIKKVEVTKY